MTNFLKTKIFLGGQVFEFMFPISIGLREEERRNKPVINLYKYKVQGTDTKYPAGFGFEPGTFHLTLARFQRSISCKFTAQYN